MRKTPNRKHKGKSLDIGLSNEFLDMKPKAQGTEAKMSGLSEHARAHALAYTHTHTHTHTSLLRLNWIKLTENVLSQVISLAPWSTTVHSTFSETSLDPTQSTEMQ